MTEYCNYDVPYSFDGFVNRIFSDCLSQCKGISKLHEVWMGDGYCDDSLSIDYCGLDFGDCGYCAYGCNFNLGFKDMLGGFCDNECNTESCLFDMGACTSPFTTCTETLLGNGVCDLECDSDSYNFDNGDCYYKTCADGCFNYMVGDSYCQPQCRVEACNYDMMDCDCSPGCFSELRADGKCDPLCDFLVCKWDQGDCGDCNSGCFTEMLGNGICDSQCNNEACDYDIKDCSCTTSCTSIIYGQCDFNCLVPACLYDQISSDPLKRCLDSDKVMLAVRTHRLMGDYSPVSLSYCTFYVESCDYESMVQTEICLSVCDFLYCPNNYYTCRSTNICDFPGCKICDDWGRCLECENHLVFQSEACNSVCSYGYQKLKYFNTGYYCFPEIDHSSMTNPYVYYVSSVRKNNSNGGDGTLENPFEDLAVAFYHIKKKYNKLVLLEDGIYEWIQMSEIYNDYDPNKMTFSPFEPNIEFQYLKITSKEGGLVNVRIPPDKNPLLIDYKGFGRFEIENIDLEWKEISSECNNLDYCEYCPHTTRNSNGEILNDKGFPINPGYLNSDLCQKFEATVLFKFDLATVLVKDCSFHDIRVGIKNLFYIDSCWFTLENVDFDNIFLSRYESSSVIAFFFTAADSYNYVFGGLTYIKGSVSRINNGFELGVDKDLRGWLYLYQTGDILIKDVKFSDNLVFLKSLTEIKAASLISVKFFKSFEIDSCEFSLNYCQGGLIYFDSENLEFEDEWDIENVVMASNRTHIYIHDSKFIGNFGDDFGILNAKFDNELPNIKLANLYVFANAVSNGPIISITCKELKPKFIEDSIQEKLFFIIWEGQNGIVKKRHAEFNDLTMIKNVAGNSGLIVFEKLAHVSIKSLVLDQNAPDDSSNINTLFIQKFLNSNIYLTETVKNPASLDCQFLGKFSNIYSLSLYVFIRNNTCLTSSPNLSIENPSKLIINNFDCLYNTANGKNPSCLSVSTDELPIEMSNSRITGNINNYSGGLGALSISTKNATALIKNLEFEANSADLGSSIHFTGKTLILVDVIFKNEKSLEKSLGVIYYSPLIDGSSPELIITGCTFWLNSGFDKGGAIHITQSVAEAISIHLLINYTRFEENKANYGSAIFIDSSASLSQESQIYSSQFTNNEAEFSGTITALFLNGILNISNCEFAKNKAKFGSALQIETGENDENGLKSKILISDSFFKANTGRGVINMDDFNVYSHLETKNCNFEDNQSCVLLSFDNWIDTSSVFRNNKGGTDSIIVLQKNSLAEITSTKFVSNESVLSAGVILLRINSIFKCDDCIFTENKSEKSGGVVYSEQYSQFIIHNSQFYMNTAVDKGSIAYLLGSSYPISEIKNCEIYENHSSQGTIVLLDSSIWITSSQIYSNTASTDTAGLYLTLSNATISNTNFSSQVALQGVFIYALTQSNVEIYDSSFVNGISKSFGGAIVSISSSILAINCEFLNLKADYGGSIVAQTFSTLFISNCTFISSMSTSSGGIINSFSSSVIVENSAMQDYSNTGIYGERLSLLNITHTEFKNGVGLSGGAVFCSSCERVFIENSEFFNNTANIGGALYVIADSDNDQFFDIFSSKFFKNNAANGGAIYSNNLKLNIWNNEFIENQAMADYKAKNDVKQFSKGGGILIKCSDLSTCLFNINYNKFTNNSAQHEGGAISWDDVMPIFHRNVFDNNFALYGENIASYPVKLSFFNSSTRILLDDSSAINISDLAPGQTIKQNLTVALEDHYGVIIKSDNTSFAEVLSTTLDTVVTGTVTIQAIEGIFIFNDFSVSAKPGTETNIEIYTSAIDPSKAGKARDNSTYYQAILITAKLRYCGIGEVTVGNNCEVCKSGFYSLNPLLATCINCPDQAICFGGYELVPKAGYWRDNIYTDEFWTCPNRDSCLESKETTSSIGLCAEGYKGNMCQSCKEGYSRTGDNVCGKCPSETENIWRLTILFVVIIFIAGLMVKSTRDTAFSPSVIISIYIKIFINYLQLVSIVSTLDLDWPDQVKTIFSIQNSANSVSEQIVSFDCLLQISQPVADIYYIKLIIMSLLPLLVVIISVFFWAFVKIIYKKSQHIKSVFWSSFVILLFLVHPMIIKSQFGVFNCTEINSGEYWLVDDLDLRCWSDKHLFYSLVVGLPGIIVWGIMTPWIYILLLRRNRRNFNVLEIQLTYGFFYTGYRPSAYYWEFVIFFRKFFIILCSIFLTNVSIEFKALTVFIILAVFLYVQYKIGPYELKQLNELEVRSILVAAVTLYCGLYYLSDLSEWLKFLFFSIIIVINLCFIYYWTIHTFRTTLKLLMDTLPFLKRCLRFNRDHDGLDELSRNPNRLNSHVLYKDGDKFYSMVISTELQTQLFKEFDAGLTVRDMFIDMLENKDAQVNTEKIEVLDPERMYQDMNGKVMVTDLE